MDMYRRRDLFYIKFIFFVRYFADAMFYSYTTLYMSSLGFKEGIIGTVSSISTITYLIVNPIWSIVTRNNKIIRILLVVLSIIEGSVIIAYGNVSVVELIMILTSLAAVAAGPYYNMLDGYAAAYCEKHGKEYSTIRVMGTLAYICAIGLCALVIDKIGFTTLFIISGCIFIIVGLLSMLLPRIELKNDKSKGNFKAILTNKRLIAYTIAYLFIVSLSVIGDNNISLFFTTVKGLTVSEYSYIQMGILIMEFLTLILAGKLLKKVDNLLLILIAGLIYLLRSLMISFIDLPLEFLIPCACLRGIAWGLVLYVHVRYVLSLVGVGNVTTAILLITVASSLFQFIMANVFGYSLEAFGYSIVYKVLAGIVAITAILYYVVSKSILSRQKIVKSCEN